MLPSRQFFPGLLLEKIQRKHILWTSGQSGKGGLFHENNRDFKHFTFHHLYNLLMFQVEKLWIVLFSFHSEYYCDY